MPSIMTASETHRPHAIATASSGPVTGRALFTRIAAALALRLLRTTVRLSPETTRCLLAGHQLVAANHVSLLDGVLVALASPVPLVFAVDTDYARRSTLARRGLAFLSRLGFGEVVPVDHAAPFGMRALRRALDAGRCVMVFPEGRISPDGWALIEQPGLEWLAVATGSDVIRLRIDGAERSRLFAKNGRHWWPSIAIADNHNPLTRDSQ